MRRGVCVPGAAMTVDAGGDPDMIGQAMRPGQVGNWTTHYWRSPLEEPELELSNMMWRRRRHDHEGTPCLLLLGTCCAFYGVYASRSIVSVIGNAVMVPCPRPEDSYALCSAI